MKNRQRTHRERTVQIPQRTRRRPHARTRRIAFPLLVLAAAASLGAGDGALDGHARFVAPDGSFSFDGRTFRDGGDGREALVHLGSWFVPEGDAAGFHHVYTQAEAIEAYRRTGAFPDGTVLVKELRGHDRADYTTGQRVASPTDPTQWFLMVKDRQGRFGDDPLWQEGWGWALFRADAPGENVAKSFAADCQGCHLPARDTDWVYVQGYPRLGSR